MELKVVIDKKFAFMILGGILILAGAIYGYAQPGIFGHSGEEINVDNEFCNRITGQDCGSVETGGGGELSQGTCTWREVIDVCSSPDSGPPVEKTCNSNEFMAGIKVRGGDGQCGRLKNYVEVNCCTGSGGGIASYKVGDMVSCSFVAENNGGDYSSVNPPCESVYLGGGQYYVSQCSLGWGKHNCFGGSGKDCCVKFQ